ncbi:PCNA-interacting partner-like isoform X1 [Montipora capricornis]|uniref:PCNA-interacting partner-like isoform X1 n=1 Tax=Montipora capricornis TaxID=246305 RepID=UPI0035F0FBF1
MADCLFWIAEENLQQIVKAFELFKIHDGWRADNNIAYLGFGFESSKFLSTCNSIPHAKLQSPLEFLINLYREHSTKKPFCDSIFDLKEQLVALQLVMAQLNKQEKGEFTVQPKDVLETHQNIVKYKLSMEDGSGETAKLCSEYNKFLSHCNAVDFVDVLQRVKTCFIMDSDAKIKFQTVQQFVVVGRPKTQLEEEILVLLAGNRTMSCFTENTDGQFFLKEETLHSFLQGINDAQEKPKKSPDPSRCQTPTQTFSASYEKAAKVQLRQVLLSYLRLLVNSRDELALSQAINIPHRGLAHQQFTALRKVAREKNMPMFQTAVSFILRIRLGGKSYAPSEDSPLLPLTKGLGEFVTFFQKLQNICEETADAKAAVLRVLNLLKVGISKSKERVFTTECLAEVVEALKQSIEQLSIENFEGKACQSTMAGMKSYYLIQYLLDQHVKQMSQQDHHTQDVSYALMTPETAHGKSKVRSLLSQFRTPDADLIADDTTPPEKLKLDPEKKPFDNHRKVHGDMTWAKPAVSIKIGPSPLTKREQMKVVDQVDVIASNVHENETYKRNIDGTPKCHSKKRTIKEAIFEKENLCVSTTESSLRYPEEELLKPSAKRILLTKDTIVRNNLKNKTMRRARPNKKQVSLLQGQKQLTSFFR